MENLVTNALKFAETHVDLCFSENEDGVTLSVTDDGLGISEKEEENVFKLFHTSAGSRTVKGIGVGLASAYRIVQAHGGRLWIDNKREHGCTFWVSIPRNPVFREASSGERLQQDEISSPPA